MLEIADSGQQENPPINNPPSLDWRFLGHREATVVKPLSSWPDLRDYASDARHRSPEQTTF
jgi:hypothetical protein